MSRMGHQLPSRRPFFFHTSKKVKNILKIPTKSEKCVHHNKGVYGERSETRSEKKKKKRKKRKEKKKGILGTSWVRNGDPQGSTRPQGGSIGHYKQPTGGIFQDLASFAIFFDSREAHF